MTGNDEILTAVAADDLDDVEGHGLKEVVVGLSAAAVLGGGMASAASAIPPIGDGLKTPGAAMGVVQGVQSDVTGVTDPTVKMATSKAGSTAADATRIVQSTTQATARTAMDAVRTVDQIAADAIGGVADTVRPIAEDPAGYATKATRPAVTTASNEVGGTLSLVERTSAEALKTAKATVVVVDTTVANSIEGATEVVLGLQSSDVDVDLGAKERSMTMQVKAGNEALGTATWQDGTWRFTVESRHLEGPVTFSVVGEPDISPVTVHFTR